MFAGRWAPLRTADAGHVLCHDLAVARVIEATNISQLTLGGDMRSTQGLGSQQQQHAEAVGAAAGSLLSSCPSGVPCLCLTWLKFETNPTGEGPACRAAIGLVWNLGSRENLATAGKLERQSSSTA
jgi:hypothetical protein